MSTLAYTDGLRVAGRRVDRITNFAPGEQLRNARKAAQVKGPELDGQLAAAPRPPFENAEGVGWLRR